MLHVNPQLMPTMLPIAASGIDPIQAMVFGRRSVSPFAAGVTIGQYGDATHVGQFTVDSQGRITQAASVAITGIGGSEPLQLYGFGGGF